MRINWNIILIVALFFSALWLLCLFKIEKADSMKVKESFRRERNELYNAIVYHSYTRPTSDNIDSTFRIINNGVSLTIPESINFLRPIALFVSEYNCISCIDTEIEILKNLDENVISQIAIITDYPHDRHNTILKKKYGLTVNVFSSSGNFEANFGAKPGTPFYAVFDSNGTVASVFVPDKTMPHLTEWYLSNVLTNVSFQ